MRRLSALAGALAFALALGGGTAEAQNTYRTPYGVQVHSPQIVTHDRQLSTSFAAEALSATAPVATVEQFDSVTLGTVPRSARYLAGYTNGLYQTYAPMRARWPLARVVGIGVFVGSNAECIDLEPGNPPASYAGPWVKWQLSIHPKGYRPCVYTMLSWMPAVRASIASEGISRSQVRLWDANWTYVKHLDPGYDCTQWNDHAYGLNLDESTCALSFYGPLPKPKPVDLDPHHYLISPSSLKWLPGGLRGGPFPSPFGNLDERLVREQEGGASQHAAKYRPYLQHTLAPELSWLAGRLVVLACGDKKSGEFNLPCNWHPFQWGPREQFLLHAAQRAGAGR